MRVIVGLAMGCVLLLGCSGSTSDNSGSGGNAGSAQGGNAGSGASSSGGSAGSTSSGGRAGSGGSTGSGGASTGGTTGSGGASTGGGAGAGGAPITTACLADAGMAPTPDPADRGTVSGTNGSITDVCDSDGNLVEGVCVTETVCGPGPNPGCDTFQTGETEEMMFDCSGHCTNGTCPSRCPDFGDTLEFLAVDGSGDATFENEVDRRRYRCVLSLGGCGSATVGQRTVIASLGLRGAFCTGGVIGNVGTALPGDIDPSSPQACTYIDCEVLPP